MSEDRTYIAIDLKSFYASAECVERGLDPLNTNLVVADESRTEKTICLAVTPSLKAWGISGRARLFEAVQRVKEVNEIRKNAIPSKQFSGKSVFDDELKKDETLEVGFIIAKPSMAKYMQISARIYEMYLKYVSSEDIHVYSVDEVFIDATQYLKMYDVDAHTFTMMLVREVLSQTGITATAGIGTNLYLAKIAMDIVAKKMPADKNGVRIAELNEYTYREKLWDHTPLTDFWRVGRGYEKRLHEHRIYTMGDVARCSVGKDSDYHNEDLLYKLFGINAELLIDHAWGYESCTIKDIKSYIPENNSLSSGQVLSEPYEYEKAKLIIKEMTDNLVLELVDKELVCSQMVLTVCYDIKNLTDPKIRSLYKGPVTADWYGRLVPKEAHGSINLGCFSSSGKLIISKVVELFDNIVDKNLLVRRMSIAANHTVPESETIIKEEKFEQLDLFTDYGALERERKEKEEALEKEKRRQKAVLEIKKKYGKNAILKGMNLQEGATAIERNAQVGGHKA